MKQACSTYERLSKKTFLSILGQKAFKKESPETYGKKDDEQYSQNKTRAYFEKLNINSWSIRSFDPNSKQVCIEIKNKSGLVNLSIKLPEIIIK